MNFSCTDLIDFLEISPLNELLFKSEYSTIFHKNETSSLERRLEVLVIIQNIKMAVLKLSILLLAVCCSVYSIENLKIKGGKKEFTNEEDLNNLIKNMTMCLKKMSEQDNTVLEFVRHHTATHQVVAGTLYDMFAEIKENGVQKNCSMSLHERPWLDYIDCRMNCGEDSKKYQWLSEAAKREKRSIPGGFTEISSDKLQTYHGKLSPYFVQLTAIKGTSFELIHIIRGKSQVVAGSHHVITAEVNKANESKTCTIDLWELVNGNEHVDIDCPNEPEKYRVTKQK